MKKPEFPDPEGKRYGKDLKNFIGEIE